MTATTAEQVEAGQALGTRQRVLAATVLQRAVCLVLSCRGLGNDRHDDMDDVEVSKNGEAAEADANRVRVIKSLVDSKRLTPCSRLLDAAKSDVRALSLQAHRVFGAGTYLVPVLNVERADLRLEARVLELAEAVETMTADWPAIVKEGKKALGGFASDKDYPSADEVRRKYSIRWSYVSFSAPENLVAVSAAIAQKANADFQARMAAAADEAVVQLRERTLAVMRELAERLKPGEDGKPKVVRGTALRDLQELVSEFPTLNLADDDKLSGIMATIAARSEGLDVETLRKAPAVKEMLIQLADQAVAQLDELVVTGRRAISFGGQL